MLSGTVGSKTSCQRPIRFRKALWTYWGGAADYGPDYHPDVLDEIQESWILLMPGEFYGGEFSQPTHRGSITRNVQSGLAGRCPPRLSDELRGQLGFRPGISSPAQTCF